MPAMFKAPKGDEIVILSRDEYDRLIERAQTSIFKPKTPTTTDVPDWKPVIWWKLLLGDYYDLFRKLEIRRVSGFQLEYWSRPLTEEEEMGISDW